MSTIHVTNWHGDIQITWDPADPASVAQARVEAQDLARQGYVFFLADGAPADPVAAATALGQGKLTCRRITVDELLPKPTESEPIGDPTLPSWRRRRTAQMAASLAASLARTEPPPLPAAATVVATRPLQGG